MIPQYIRGCIAPVFTACNEDGSLDDEGQRGILEALHDTHAVNAYFVRSGMGQMFTFTLEEAKQIARVSCEHLAGRGAVLAGCAGIWDRNRDRLPDPGVFLKQAIELSQYAESVGAAGVVHAMPEGIAPKAGESCADVVYRYYETISNAVKIPVLIYQSPGTDERYCVDMALAARLAQLPNVMGMKLSNSDAGYIFDICYAVKDEQFAFICGCELAFLAALASGARAVIGQGATVNPAILKAIQDRYEKGDILGARDAQRATNLMVEKSKNTQEFYKRYIAEKGYKVKPFGRFSKANAYFSEPQTLSNEDYESYKRLLESELEKYPV